MCDLGLSVWSLHDPVYLCMFSSFSIPNKCSISTFSNPKGCVCANAFLCWYVYLSRVCPTQLPDHDPWRTLDGCYVNGQKHLKTLRIERLLLNAYCDLVIPAATLKVCRDHDLHVRLYATLPTAAKLVLWCLLNCWRSFCDFLAFPRLHPSLEHSHLVRPTATRASS